LPTHATADVIEAMSKLLRRWAVIGKLENENRWGVDVVYSKKEIGLTVLRFVTKEDLLVELEFDFRRLVVEKEAYVESRVKIVMSSIEAAKEERQRQNSVVLFPEKKLPTEVRSAINKMRTLH
jgi:hypothetical protein